MSLRIKRIKHQILATKVSTAQYRELSRMWKRVERKWHVDIEDVSVEMTMLAQIVKEVTFKGKRGSKPLHITIDWDSVMWAEDGTELSEFETEKNVAEQVDSQLEFMASEGAI